MTSEMPISPTRASTLTQNLTSVLTRISSASPTSKKPPRLVAPCTPHRTRTSTSAKTTSKNSSPKRPSSRKT
ncbi:MAG: hypothetical protein L6R42_006725 [Xanthoria sp. 1 TBL-2021]|nr:MAG: hypothetical protein L6R42_006725 [Xanthoria sp. 1 TBL-2021]